MGPSGSGKTSLLRAMAGLWNTGRGTITFYVKDGEYPLPSISSDGNPPEVSTVHDMHGELERPINRNSRGIFFLPQRPYPTWAEDAIANSESAKPSGM
jgi:ABC-type uncharacterized transport system fused permease/ATPase subunit